MMTWCIGVVLFCICALWAYKPLHKVQPDIAISVESDPDLQNTSEQTQYRNIDRSVFSVKLWNPSSVDHTGTELDEPVTIKLQKPNFQLIGIIVENGQTKAALYDPTEDKICIVAHGDHIHQFEITSIDDDSVDLVADNKHYRLEMQLVGEGG